MDSWVITQNGITFLGL